VRKGESEVGDHELLDVRTANICTLLNFDNTKDVDRPETSTVSSSHILVHALYSVGPRKLTVLLIHVVGARPGVVSEPDTEIFDLQRLLLVNLQDTKEVSDPIPPAS
jgi:hypothetical protein